jgi:ABC transport system ATP-binding/permease protein
MWKLVIEDDEAKRTTVPLTRSEYTVGRREGNIIRLTERNVSRQHARFYRKTGAAGEAGTLILEDLTSYNGVFVNGLRITHAQALAHGDLVQIGDYRIILQDDALAAATEAAGGSESQQTVPSAPHPRGTMLLDRPNRLVMLAGPTPGAEFPLDRERMTIGRAEDATVSVNHNSVSRLHCEVHALGDGRFEIVDKGSSNGVRVNGAELRRGIVEPGDVVELGDVRFKFVGAGQIFLPTESHQLATITDREPHEGARARRLGNALPIAVFAVVVCAGAAGAWSYTRPRFPARAAIPVPESAEQIALDEAKKLAAAGDWDGAHAKLEGSIADSSGSSRWRDAPEFKDIESHWAEALLMRGDKTSDGATKRALYQTVSQAMSVDAPHRKIAADRLQELDANAGAISANATDLPVAANANRESGKARADDASAPSPRNDGGRRTVWAQEAAAPLAAQGGSAFQGAGTPNGVDERERQLALQGTPDSKILLKQQLEPRVFGGRASDTEVRLLISTCKDLGDKSCVQQARAVLGSQK